MSLIHRRSTLENPATPLTADQLASFLGLSGRTAAGVVVNTTTATRHITVAACQRLIAETIATLPVGLYNTDSDGKTRQLPDPRWLNQPNPDIDRIELLEDLLYGLLGDGNGFSQLTFKAGEVWEIYPQLPEQVDLKRPNPAAPLTYLCTNDWGQTEWASDQVLHVRAFRRPGSLRGISPIERHRQAIGLGLATEEFGAGFFGNGATASGVIETPNDMSPNQARILMDSFMAQHTGVGNAHRPGVLSNGASWRQVSIPPEHAQFLETQEFSVSQIARMYRCPPHLVGDVDKSTSWGTGIEEQNIAFVVYTLRTWITRLESAFTRLVRGPRATTGPFIRFDVEGLLRGNIESRYKAYATGRQWGWESVNSILALEGREPIASGDVYLSPLNMISATDSAVRPARDRAQAAYFLAQAGFPPAACVELLNLDITEQQLTKLITDQIALTPPKPPVAIDPNDPPGLDDDPAQDPSDDPSGGAPSA